MKAIKTHMDHLKEIIARKFTGALDTDDYMDVIRHRLETFGERRSAPWDLKPSRSAEEAFEWIGVQKDSEAVGVVLSGRYR